MIIDKSKIVAKYINNKETLLKIISNSKPNKETNTGFWLFDECIKKDSVYSKINEGPWYIKYIVYLYENKPIALRSFSEDYYTKYESDKKLKEQFKNYVRLFDFQVDSKYKGNRIQQYAWNHLKEIEQKKGFEGFTLMCYEESLQQKYKNDGFHGNQRFMWKSFNESYNIMRNKKALYESIMIGIAKEVKRAINEQTYDDAILEKYGLEYIFAINENGISNIFEKFKKPLQNTLNKIKNKFGDKPNKFIVNIIKRASAKGEKTLYLILTALTLLTGTLQMNAKTTIPFNIDFNNQAVQTSAKLVGGGEFSYNLSRGMIQDLKANTANNEDFYAAVNTFQNILNELRKDDIIYCLSGIGIGSTKKDAKQNAKKDLMFNYSKSDFNKSALGKEFKEFEQKEIMTISVGENTYLCIMAGCI